MDLVQYEEYNGSNRVDLLGMDKTNESSIPGYSNLMGEPTISKQQQNVFIRGADRRTLQNLRVIRRTLVYAIGLSPNFAQVNTLKQPEYFGQYGEIVKLVINHHHGVAQDDPRYGSASAYITFRRQEDAWAAICSVDGFRLMGRTIRASFGTTKYCNSFLRNLPCNNPDCLYLHELGDQEDRFTKDEVQLGLARHGSSFAFKETVLGNRNGEGDSSGGSTVGARQPPANPVLPPPCAMPPASYHREDMKYQQRASRNHHHDNDSGNGQSCNGLQRQACSSALVYPPCEDCENGCGVASAGAAEAFLGENPGSSLPQDGVGVGDDRRRPRRRRGQRGRRGAGIGARSGPKGAVSNEAGVDEGEEHDQSGGGPQQHGGGFVRPANLDTFFDYGIGDASFSNDKCLLYHPMPKLTHVLGCSHRSPGSSRSGSSTSNSSSSSSISISNTPPLELSRADTFSPASASTSLLGVRSNGTAPRPREVWNQTQYQHLPRPVPTFFGMEEAGAVNDSADQLWQKHPQQQQQHLRRDGAKGGGMCVEELLALSEVRQGLDILHLQEQQQQQQRLEDERKDERASIAALQLQVQQLQQYIKTKNVEESGGRSGSGAAFLPPGLGLLDGKSGDLAGASSRCSNPLFDDVSSLGDRLAAFSWDDDDEDGDECPSSQQCEHQHRHYGGAGGGNGLGRGRGGNSEGDALSWAASIPTSTPSALSVLGAFAPASTVSQAEAAEWRRATPRLFA